MELYCAAQGWTFELVSDLGSGMNSYKKGLKKLLNEILSEKIGRLVITHKDRSRKNQKLIEGMKKVAEDVASTSNRIKS